MRSHFWNGLSRQTGTFYFYRHFAVTGLSLREGATEEECTKEKPLKPFEMHACLKCPLFQRGAKAAEEED